MTKIFYKFFLEKNFAQFFFKKNEQKRIVDNNFFLDKCVEKTKK